MGGDEGWGSVYRLSGGSSSAHPLPLPSLRPPGTNTYNIRTTMTKGVASLPATTANAPSSSSVPSEGQGSRSQVYQAFLRRRQKQTTRSSSSSSSSSSSVASLTSQCSACTGGSAYAFTGGGGGGGGGEGETTTTPVCGGCGLVPLHLCRACYVDRHQPLPTACYLCTKRPHVCISQCNGDTCPVVAKKERREGKRAACHA